MAGSRSFDQILARIAKGKPTRKEVVDLVAILDARNSAMEFIQIEVKRGNDRPTEPIKLLGRTGPTSCADRKLNRICTGRYTAWFKISDLREWVGKPP